MVHLIRFFIRLLSLALVLLALVVVGLRIGLANIDYFEVEIKHWLSSEVASDINFIDIQGGWNRFNPILRLANASVILPNRDQPISVDRMAVELDLVNSVWLRKPVIREISGAIKNLSLSKDTSGQWWLNETMLGGTGTSGADTSVAALVSKFPHYLNLELKRLSLFDQKSEQRYEFEWIQVGLQQHDDSFHLELATNLPQALGDQLLVKAIVKQDSSLVYLKSSRLEPVRIAELLDLDTSGLQQAEVSGEIWLNLIDKQIVGLNGNLSLNEGLFQKNSDAQSYAFDLSSQISVRQFQGSWFVSSQLSDLNINNVILDPFNSEIRIAGSSSQSRIEGWIEDFELSNFRVLDARILPDKTAEILQKSEIKGQLSNIWFSLEPDDIGNLMVTAEASNVASLAVGGIPGVSKLNGAFVLGKKNAGMDIAGSQMVLDFTDQFRTPLDVDKLKLSANISLIEGDFLISVPSFEITNSDLRGTGRLWLETSKADRPFMYLRAQFADARGGSASKYVPVKIMPEKVISWVDRGVKNADSPHGDLLYHGRLKDIKKLTKDRAGELIVDFQVENAEVLFDPNWPVAHNGSGRVIFHNTGVEVVLEKVSLEGIDNGVANITIADFEHAEIEVDVETRASTEVALKTWIKTPVGNQYESIVKGFRKVDGSVKASIGILLPISDKNKKQQVDVKLIFEDGAVEVPAWGLDLARINGELQITEQNLMAKSVKANYFGDAIDINISTDAKNDRTIVRAEGGIKSQQLLVLLPNYLKHGFKGNSDWRVEIGIANNRVKSQRPIVQIEAASDMLKTEVLFPSPFKKPAQSSQPTRIQVSIFENNQVGFKLAYGANISAKGKLETGPQGVYQLYNLGLGFSTALRKKSSPGIKVYGSLRQLSLDEWVDYYHSRIETEGAKASDLVDLIDSIDLEVQSAYLFGNKLTNSYLNMERIDDDLIVNIDSSLIKGRLDIPLQNSPGDPVVAELDFLRLRSSEGESEPTELTPQDMINLRLHSKVFSYDEMEFTDLQIDARQQADEFTIENLSFRNNKILLSSAATWQYATEAKQHLSAVKVSISGQEFGQTLTDLGLGDALLNGEIKLDGQMNWSAELFNPGWETLAGDARLELSKGVFKNVDPGSGRIVGLMSLSALPRRFSLDFKDVLLEGLDFDKITGSYRIDGEDFYTSDTSMEGPSAKVLVKGRTGLLERDYDQQLIITPRIRTTLPLIGGLAAGTTVGLGFLLLQNLFKDVIDESVRAEYRVTGTWDNPQVELVKKAVYEKIDVDK